MIEFGKHKMASNDSTGAYLGLIIKCYDRKLDINNCFDILKPILYKGSIHKI